MSSGMASRKDLHITCTVCRFQKPIPKPIQELIPPPPPPAPRCAGDTARRVPKPAAALGFFMYIIFARCHMGYILLPCLLSTSASVRLLGVIRTRVHKTLIFFFLMHSMTRHDAKLSLWRTFLWRWRRPTQFSPFLWLTKTPSRYDARSCDALKATKNNRIFKWN